MGHSAAAPSFITDAHAAGQLSGIERAEPTD
jgi:hypothetical protein